MSRRVIMDGGGTPSPYWQEFETELATQKQAAWNKFTKDLQEQESTARKRFERQWRDYAALQRRLFQEQVTAQRKIYKRQYLQTYGRHPRPREVSEGMQAWRQSEIQAFEDRLTGEQQRQEQLFEQNVTSWKSQNVASFEQQFSSWATEQRGVFRAELATWEQQVAATEAEWKDLKAKWDKMTVDQAMAGVNKHWGTRRGDPGYSKYYDFNQDGIVDLRDLTLIAKQAPPPPPSPEELATYDVAAPFGIIDVADIAVLAKRGVSKAELEKISKLYGTKYLEITELPEGAVPTAITYEAGEFILQYKIPAPEEPTGLAEYLAGIELEKPPLRKWREAADLRSWVFGEAVEPTYRPLAPVAGIVAAFEAPAYSVARLIGVPAPRPPPTFTGAVVGEFISAAAGVLGYEYPKPARAWEVMTEYGAGYVAGTVIGDIAVSYLLGYTLGKAWEKAKAVTPVRQISEAWKYSHLHYLLTKAETRIYTSIYAPVYRATLGKVRPPMEAWLRQHSAWYYARSAAQISGIQEVTLGSIGYGRQGLAEIFGFAMMRTPRTAGVWVAKAAAREMLPKAPAITGTVFAAGEFMRIYREPLGFEKVAPVRQTSLEEWIYGKAKFREYIRTEPLGFTKETWRMAREGTYFFEKARWPTVAEMKERGLLPLITQTQLTRLGVVPTIAKPTISPLISRGILATEPIGLAVLMGLKALERPVPKKIREPKLIPAPGVSEWILGKEISIPVEAEIAAPKAKVVPLSVAAQTLQTGQVGQQIFQTGIPSGVFGIPVSVPPKRRKRKRKKKKRKPKRKPLKWERYQIVYPVAEVGEVAEYVMGKKRK